MEKKNFPLFGGKKNWAEKKNVQKGVSTHGEKECKAVKCGYVKGLTKVIAINNYTFPLLVVNLMRLLKGQILKAIIFPVQHHCRGPGLGIGKETAWEDRWWDGAVQREMQSREEGKEEMGLLECLMQ